MIKNINVNPAPAHRGDVTSVDLEQFARYKANGLTYVSDNNNIIPRNTAGDIIIQQSASMNELLIIEPMVNNISTKSVLRVIDTSFQYYKFPVSTVTIIDDAVDLDIDLTVIEDDIVYARYKPSANYTAAVYDSTNAGVDQYSGILLDEVVDGISQTNINSYTVSKELKNSGKDLRIRIKVSHNYTNMGTDSQSLFVITIQKSGPNYPLNRKWKGEFASALPSGITGEIEHVYNEARKIFYNSNLAKLYAVAGLPYYNNNDDVRYRFDAIALFNESGLSFHGENNMLYGPVPNSVSRLTSNQITAIDTILNCIIDPVVNASASAAQIALRIAYTNYNQLAVTNSNGWSYIYSGTTQIIHVDEIIPNSEFEAGDSLFIGALGGHSGHTIMSEQTYVVITDASKIVDEWNQEI